MGIIWLASCATMMIAIFSGISYRYDPFHYTNNPVNVATAVADNLQTLSTAGVAYSIENQLKTTTIFNNNMLIPFLPINFKNALNYIVLFSQDESKNNWLILSYNSSNFRAISGQSFDEDILRIITQRVNNKSINNNNKYQLAYLGINTGCNLSSELQSLTLNVSKSFNYICNNNSANILKYVLMIPIKYY